MSIDILQTESHSKGKIFLLHVEDKKIRILALTHALERIKRWKLTEEKVLQTVIFPDEVVIGHRNRFIAHKVYGDHVIRVVYEYQERLPTLVTVYFPSKERYYQGGEVYEDQIFKRG